MSGVTTKAAIGPAQVMCQIGLIPSPTGAINERYGVPLGMSGIRPGNLESEIPDRSVAADVFLRQEPDEEEEEDEGNGREDDEDDDHDDGYSE
jgi:hypothetical protein